uniref:Uncharacterized protein n=1 Tax=Ciona intestinalis TaxID=7719 RepID=H2XT71_CIOIN
MLVADLAKHQACREGTVKNWQCILSYRNSDPAKGERYVAQRKMTLRSRFECRKDSASRYTYSDRITELILLMDK